MLPEPSVTACCQWNDTERDYAGPGAPAPSYRGADGAGPGGCALEFEGEEFSYGKLNPRANQLARFLRRKGVGPDVLVGVFAERSFEMVVALLAVLKAGGAYVPLDPDYPPERLAHMLEDAEAPVVLTQPHLAARCRPCGGCSLLDPSWDGLSSTKPDENLEDDGAPDDLAYVIYTSGSTGRPKGAMNEHRGICNRLLWMQEQYGHWPLTACCRRRRSASTSRCGSSSGR